jgi:acetyl esterase
MTRLDVRRRLDPEMLAAVAESQRLHGAETVDWTDLPAARRAYERERRFWNSDGPRLHEVRELAIPGPHGAIPLRLYFPIASRPLPALVYLHGGGYVLGNLDTHDRIMRILAERAGAAVIGVDYRLAPEHRFPVQIDEAAAVLDWLDAEGAARGIDAARLAMGGDSAGAHLSVGVALARQGRRPALKGLLLYYGSYGLTDSVSMRLNANDLDGVTRTDMAFYRSCYLRSPADLEDPRFDCLSADLAGLPPAFVLALDLDPLRDDSLALADLLAEAGVPCRLVRYGGVLHGFLHYSRLLPKSMQALEEGAAALRGWFA